MEHTPRVAAVHDLSGFGRCSLTVALPVLAAMGVQCCPLPTAYLSAHTGFPASHRAVFHDLTEVMEPTLPHWQELGVTFDAVYSGFLGSAEQIDALHRLIDTFREENTLVVVDPVMGDHGALYRTYTEELCRRMAELAARADLITPNLTEAALLMGEPYDPNPGPGKVRRWLEQLSGGGTRSVVITGVSLGPDKVGCACFDRTGGTLSHAGAPVVEGRFSGTGDLFASVTLGRLLQGNSLADAAADAVFFTQRCAAHTREKGLPPVCGAEFEPLLPLLMQQTD